MTFQKQNGIKICGCCCPIFDTVSRHEYIFNLCNNSLYNIVCFIVFGEYLYIFLTYMYFTYVFPKNCMACKKECLYILFALSFIELIQFQSICVYLYQSEHRQFRCLSSYFIHLKASVTSDKVNMNILHTSVVPKCYNHGLT